MNHTLAHHLTSVAIMVLCVVPLVAWAWVGFHYGILG